MIAINQVLAPKSSNGGIVEEATSNPEVPFANTLDELVEGSAVAIETEKLLLAELEADPTFADLEAEEAEIGLLQENLLETLAEEESQLGLAVPIAPELLPNTKQSDRFQNGDSIKQQTGLSRLEILQQGKPLSEEFILVPEQRTDIKALEKGVLAKQQTKLGEKISSIDINHSFVRFYCIL